jgi:hypothetical protein
MVITKKNTQAQAVQNFYQIGSLYKNSNLKFYYSIFFLIKVIIKIVLGYLYTRIFFKIKLEK